MKPMSPEAKELWLKRLETETKIEGSLVIPGVGCCAVGALVLAAKDGGVKLETRLLDERVGFRDPRDEDARFDFCGAPRCVYDWAGLGGPTIVADEQLLEVVFNQEGEDKYKHLAANKALTLDELNDDYSSATFPVIADFIRRSL